MYRLRRLCACVPGLGDLRTGRSSGKVEELCRAQREIFWKIVHDYNFGISPKAHSKMRLCVLLRLQVLQEPGRTGADQSLIFAFIAFASVFPSWATSFPVCALAASQTF